MAKPKFHWSLNEEWKKKAIAKIKIARAKQTPTNLGRKWSDEFKEKVRQGMKKAIAEGRAKNPSYWTGKKLSKEHRQNMREAQRKFNYQNSGRFQKGSKVNLGRVRLDMQGSNNPNWKGGITPAATKRVADPYWRRLAKTIYKRDNWCCRVCGIHCRETIQCHHIKSVRKGGTDKPVNLVTLDRAHHLKIERSKFQDFWTYFFQMEIKVSPN